MYIRYKVLRILAYSSPILPNNLGWSNPANRTTKTHLNWPRVRLVTSLLHITSSNGDRSSARADIDPNLDVSSVFSRKRGGCRAASWPWFSSARNSYHVCIYIYILRRSFLSSRGLDFSSGEKWGKHGAALDTRRCSRFTRRVRSTSRPGWVHTKGAADYGDLRSAGREIIPWSGEQKGERFVRPSRNFMAPRVRGVGERACGLTSIKPSKSYLSRLATGGLILLFNVCFLSLPFFSPPLVASFPFSFAPRPVLLSRNNIFRRSTFHPLLFLLLFPSRLFSFVFFFSLPIRGGIWLRFRGSHVPVGIRNVTRVFARAEFFERWEGNGMGEEDWNVIFSLARESNS